MSTITTKKLGTTGLNMMEYLPTGYDPTKAYPVFPYFVGAGEIGVNPALMLSHGPFQFLKNGVDLGLDIIALVIQYQDQNPQPGQTALWVKTIKSLYNVSALILNGVSRGGQTIEWYANNSEANLSNISAMLLVSSQGTVGDNPNIPGTFNPALYLKHNIFLWWEIGTNDPFYDGNKARYKAYSAIAPNLAKWTEYAGPGHDSGVWNPAYDPASANAPYKWAASFGAATVVVPPPPIVIPPPVVVPPAKTIKSITIVYSDGSSEVKP